VFQQLDHRSGDERGHGDLSNMSGSSPSQQFTMPRSARITLGRPWQAFSAWTITVT
jgi:hypothetical protein